MPSHARQGLYRQAQRQTQKPPLPNPPLRYAQGRGLFAAICQFAACLPPFGAAKGRAGEGCFSPNPTPNFDPTQPTQHRSRVPLTRYPQQASQ